MKSYQFSEFVLFALKFALKWFLHNRTPGRLEHHFILMPIKLRKCFFRRLFFRLFFFFFDFRFFFLLLPVLINIDKKKDHIYLKFCYIVKLILMYNYPGNWSKTFEEQWIFGGKYIHIVIQLDSLHRNDTFLFYIC